MLHLSYMYYTLYCIISLLFLLPFIYLIVLYDWFLYALGYRVKVNN
jgi:hypothetical protein